MKRSNYSILAITMLALSLLISGCGHGNSEQAAQARVTAAKAELQDAQTALKAQQAAQPSQKAEVTAAQSKLKAAQAQLRAERAKDASGSQASRQPVCSDCGTISAIDERQTQGSRKSPAAIAGTVLGAVAGVAIGNQIGHGGGKKAAKVVGGLGGAAAGNQIGKHFNKNTYYAVAVNMDAGGSRTINVPDATGLTVGQSVRVQGNTIVPQ